MVWGAALLASGTFACRGATFSMIGEVPLPGGGDMGPGCLAIADYNGDGSLDVVVSQYGFRWGVPGAPGGWNNTVAFLTNDGGGTFTQQAEPTVGHGPAFVMAEDVNADGWPDVVCANQSDDTLSVLANNRSGGFNDSVTVATGDGPNAVAALDVDGDGMRDLVSANLNADTLTLLLNNGSGGFTATATIPAGDGPYAMATADFNSDGKPDLAVVNNNAGTLTVLLHDGNGSLAAAATLMVGNTPDAVVAADLNGDAKPDLVVVNWGSNSMTLLTNNGNGTFSNSSTLGVGSHPSTVAVADIDGDGDRDLVCANTNVGSGSTPDGSFTTYTNNGSGTFSNAGTLDYGWIPNIWAPDVDADGRPDLMLVNFRSASLTVLRNTTAFPAVVTIPSLTISRPGDGLLVAWPSASPGWSLQETSDLQPPHWGPSGYGGQEITDDGVTKSLRLPYCLDRRFFRLLHP